MPNKTKDLLRFDDDNKFKGTKQQYKVFHQIAAKSFTLLIVISILDLQFIDVHLLAAYTRYVDIAGTWLRFLEGH